LLSQCNDDSDDIDAGATTEVAVRDDESDRASGESSSGESGDGDSQADSGAGSDAGGSQGGRSELQIEVDEALSGTGVTGVALDGVVTLTGTVEDAESASDAEGLVASLAGVESVDNEIEVDGSEDDGGEQEAETGDTINELLDLDPVTFRVNSATITDAGKAVLDDAAGFMLANPDISVEIGGHTDNDGSQSDNLDLSQRRADSVEAYLIGRGVEGDRLEAKGYGETQPKVPNDTAAAKAENRRIEFTIL
jgi:outer membrane protein OmpA-like peptidoglycan-associated protein